MYIDFNFVCKAVVDQVYENYLEDFRAGSTDSKLDQRKEVNLDLDVEKKICEKDDF
ncbi:MAG: hypothetical protein RR561_07550 [Peptostreptococcus sp.]|uniref:hypothetical protein n=1 Tax=Peptostreptococcus sp. TaxID=1262 RepID=UPI002FC5E241